MTPCFRGEVNASPALSSEEEAGASKAFDTAETSVNVDKLQEDIIQPETGLSIIEDIPTYEVTKNIFGIEKVRRVK